ncbi:hypothetical protein P167DRAFT_608616 [Morchella conica CCBAS932]|uniref:Uncharacterized protein n=1 Tax=Morchella conica CCBAS932 TaxID=1392247 RepID=A0A3N4KDJ0_9PEZI|nr:hypothetical protein P167DRAFT_608616 [Morchella conica CCBAS932]
MKRTLASAKSSLYTLNKTSRATGATSTTTTSLNTSPPGKAAKEDYIERRSWSISLHAKRSFFSGTDPGIVVTSVTVPRTLESIFASINHFQALTDSSDGAPRGNTAKKLAKEKREREVRMKRVYGKITAQERRHIRAHAQLPPDAPKPVLIHCVGHWQGINSCIKGHSRREMKQIREQHRVYGNVAITNEYNSSKTCPLCSSKVHLARRTVDGKERVVRLHGAVECVHPRCPARRIPHTTRGRDADAAANIALSGASII